MSRCSCFGAPALIDELGRIADTVLLLHRIEAAPEELRVLKRKDRLGGR